MFTFNILLQLSILLRRLHNTRILLLIYCLGIAIIWKLGSALFRTMQKVTVIHWIIIWLDTGLFILFEEGLECLQWLFWFFHLYRQFLLGLTPMHHQRSWRWRRVPELRVWILRTSFWFHNSGVSFSLGIFYWELTEIASFVLFNRYLLFIRLLMLSGIICSWGFFLGHRLSIRALSIILLLAFSPASFIFFPLGVWHLRWLLLLCRSLRFWWFRRQLWWLLIWFEILFHQIQIWIDETKQHCWFWIPLCFERSLSLFYRLSFTFLILYFNKLSVGFCALFEMLFASIKGTLDLGHFLLEGLSVVHPHLLWMINCYSIQISMRRLEVHICLDGALLLLEFGWRWRQSWRLPLRFRFWNRLWGRCYVACWVTWWRGTAISTARRCFIILFHRQSFHLLLLRLVCLLLLDFIWRVSFFLELFWTVLLNHCRFILSCLFFSLLWLFRNINFYIYGRIMMLRSSIILLFFLALFVISFDDHDLIALHPKTATMVEYLLLVLELLLLQLAALPIFFRPSLFFV